METFGVEFFDVIACLFIVSVNSDHNRVFKSFPTSRLGSAAMKAFATIQNVLVQDVMVSSSSIPSITFSDLIASFNISLRLLIKH